MSVADLPPNFREKIHLSESGCWEWTACLSTNGYAKVGYQGRAEYAHRVVYELLVGPIPEGLVIDHLCRVHHCVNPEHVEPVTMRENTLRGESPGARTLRTGKCVRGHDMDDSNTYVYPDGNRRGCRACAAMHAREYNAARTETPPPSKTHCLRGHPFDEENTYIDSSFRRHCKACRTIRDRSRRQAGAEL